MTTVKATCPETKETVRMPIERVVLRLAESTTFSFACSICGGAHTRPFKNQDRVLDLLDEGVESVVVIEDTE